MKVLHVIPSIAPVRGGPSYAVMGLVRALNEEGVAAEIVTTNDDGPRTLDVPLGQRIDWEGVPVWFFQRYSPPAPTLREYVLSISLMRWVWRHVTDYDLIHVHAIFSFSSTVAMIIARIKKVPYITRPLGQLCSWSLAQSKIRKKVYLGLIEKENLKHAAAIHFTSALEAQDFPGGLLPKNQFILPHGIKTVFFFREAAGRLRDRLKVSQDAVLILFMSRPHPKKGLDLLIPALAGFRDQDFRLILAGGSDPDYEREMWMLIGRSGLHEKVIRVPHLRGEEKELFLRGADLFALTSYSENFGITVLEALAAGTPVLVSKEVGLSDFVRKINAGYITDMTVESIANALAMFFSNIAHARSDRERIGKTTQDEFSWRKIAHNLADKYREILKEDQ